MFRIGVLVMLVLFFACAAPAQAPLRIGLITNGTGEYWQSLTKEVKQKIEAGGAILDIRTPTLATPEIQQQVIDQVMESGVAVLAICPVEGEKQTGYLKAVSNRVPLVLVGDDVPESGRRCSICQDFSEMGRMIGETLAKLVPGEMKIAALTKAIDSPSTRACVEGIRRGLSPTRIILDVIKEDRGDSSLAWANVDELMGKRPELAAYVALEPYQMPALLRSAQCHKMLRLVNLIGSGNTQETRTAFDKGEIMVLVNPDVSKLADVLSAALLALAKNDLSFKMPENGIFNIAPLLEQTKTKISHEEMLDALQVPRVLQETGPIARPSFE